MWDRRRERCGGGGVCEWQGGGVEGFVSVRGGGIELPAFMVFHTANAWEDKDGTVKVKWHTIVLTSAWLDGVGGFGGGGCQGGGGGGKWGGGLGGCGG